MGQSTNKSEQLKSIVPHNYETRNVQKFNHIFLHFQIDVSCSDDARTFGHSATKFSAGIRSLTTGLSLLTKNLKLKSFSVISLLFAFKSVLRCYALLR